MNRLFVIALVVFLAVCAGAEDKPAVSPKTPTLTDPQRVALLQAEVKVLTSQVEDLQAQLNAKDKEFAFKSSLSDLYKQGETTAKDAGANQSDYDLDLNTLTFKERPKPAAPVVTPAPAKK